MRISIRAASGITRTRHRREYMENNTKPKRKSPFSRFQTDRYTWHDNIIIIVLLFLGLTILAIIAEIIMDIIVALIFGGADNGALNMFVMYIVTAGQWIVFLGYELITKRNRPMAKALTPKAKGNTLKMFLLGMLIGGGENALCILIAIIHGDIYLVFDCFKPLPLLAILFAVLVQSSSEELMCRNFLYQRLARGHKSPLVPRLS